MTLGAPAPPAEAAEPQMEHLILGQLAAADDPRASRRPFGP
ncbi:hypothetical protein C884_02208 [Kocuria palustris PEL]|uniref:Uncharacterized protein n=1 Tax=Kocuria palustris PEL TaxID=1236550 RepID=M2WEU1_9MICC|nr:hypothetical protein C884_02208 [Kocuria palustris PEL]